MSSNFCLVTDRRTDRETESDAYEPTVQCAQMAKKFRIILVSILTCSMILYSSEALWAVTNVVIQRDLIYQSQENLLYKNLDTWRTMEILSIKGCVNVYEVKASEERFSQVDCYSAFNSHLIMNLWTFLHVGTTPHPQCIFTL